MRNAGPSPAGRAEAIGFPPGLLREDPVRLPLLGRGPGWIAVEKPAGVAAKPHPWNTTATDIESALNRQLEAGKQELVRLGADSFGSVYTLDPEIGGPLVLALDRETGESLRNDFGSDRFRFTFELVARNDGGEAARECDAPLLRHRTVARMVPSTAKGKKCRTVFTRLGTGAQDWSLWRAEAVMIRPHQIRAHSRCAGLPVAGDREYGGEALPTLRELRRGVRGAGVERRVFDGPALRLVAVSVPQAGGAVRVGAPPPGAWRSLLRKLKLDPWMSTG